MENYEIKSGLVTHYLVNRQPRKFFREDNELETPRNLDVRDDGKLRNAELTLFLRTHILIYRISSDSFCARVHCSAMTKNWTNIQYEMLVITDEVRVRRESILN